MSRRAWAASSGSLLLLLGAAALALASWKSASRAHAAAESASRPEPADAVTVGRAREREHRRTATAIGTVLALRSITLRNEVSGTVREVSLAPGTVVEPGVVLVALDTSVEEAELAALEAQAALAELTLGRLERLGVGRTVTQMEVDRARADLDVARAQIARTKAVVARKLIRAPFRARVGLSDVHPGQFLHEGTELTTLQGVDDAVHVDFSVTQRVAESLKEGDRVRVRSGPGAPAIEARIGAIDARVDPATRSARVRARIEDGAAAPSPGASVRVEVPFGAPTAAVAVPATALRRGPAGDHVFVIEDDPHGKPRAHVRPVRSGPGLGDEVLLLEGLAAGERVAASGSFKLREGSLVGIVEEGDGHGPAPR